jgi:hypothetical protein
MDLSEIGGTCELNQLFTFGRLPNKALHLGREDNIDLVLADELDQASEIRTLFFRVYRCANVVLFKDGNNLNSQATILGVALGLRKTLGDLYGGIRTYPARISAQAGIDGDANNRAIPSASNAS